MLPEHWFDRLERRFEFVSIPNLATFLVAMNAVIWIMTMARPEFPYRLVLFPDAVWAGEWWRVLTFAVVPPAMAPLWMVFWLLLLYTYGAALEQEWGDFRFNLFYGVGVVATVLAALASRWPLSNTALNASLFLAFAKLYPDFVINLFFVIPVRARWLAALAALGLAWRFLAHGPAARWEVTAGVVNYLLFFGGDHLEEVKRLWRRRGR